MERKTRIACIVASAMAGVLIAGQRPRAEAWNDRGHCVVAQVAYRQLSPKAQDEAIRILKADKTPKSKCVYDQLKEAIGGFVEDPEDFRECLFEKAATWPDLIRGNDAESMDDWHFINLAIKPDPHAGGAPAQDLTATLAENAGRNDVKNAVQALQWNARMLVKPQANAHEKARALCWVMHLVGDVHQPLHCAALVTAAFPEGDRGGGWFRVKDPTLADPPQNDNLHKFWDRGLGLIDRAKPFADVFGPVVAQADDLLARLPRTQTNVKAGLAQDAKIRAKSPAAELAEPLYLSWAKKSRDLAETWAYAIGNGTVAPIAPGGTLDDDYVSHARDLAEKRATLAGYRLADLLNRLLDK